VWREDAAKERSFRYTADVARRIQRALGVALVLMLLAVAGGLGFALWRPRGLGHFDGPDGGRAYRAAYSAAMARLPRPTVVDDVATDFGTVRVYAFGVPRAVDEAPILLLPGRSSGVPMWLPNLPGLASSHRVLAVDCLGDAGFSVQTQPLLDAADQAAWIEQVLARLGVARVHVVGHSFGGWLAANYALRHPERVATVSLLEPVLVFGSLRWQLIAATIPATLSFLPQAWRDRALSYIGGDDAPPDPADPVARMIALASEHYAADLPLPSPFTDEELRRLRMPVYAAFAGRTVVHEPETAAARARTFLRRGEVRLWPEASHSLPLEFPAEVNREIVAFIAAARPEAGTR